VFTYDEIKSKFRPKMKNFDGSDLESLENRKVAWKQKHDSVHRQAFPIKGLKRLAKVLIL
jgi:hypothetical protein